MEFNLVDEVSNEEVEQKIVDVLLVITARKKDMFK